jgi:amidase
MLSFIPMFIHRCYGYDDCSTRPDRLIASGKTPPPLLGVPITVKENIDCKGSSTTFAVTISMLPSVKPIISQGALKFLENWVELHPDCGHTGYMAGFAMRKAIAREWSLFQQKYPLILGPVVGTQPFKIDMDTNSVEGFKKILNGYPLSMAANVLGLPAVALPVGIANDLPQGVQLLGPRYYECLCLGAAQTIEDSLGTISPPGFK